MQTTSVFGRNRSSQCLTADGVRAVARIHGGEPTQSTSWLTGDDSPKEFVKAVSECSFALPNHDGPPPEFSQLCAFGTIAHDISSELGPPKLDSGCGRRGKPAAGMPVPEASMHEYGRSVLRYYKIRRARESSVVHAKPESGSVKVASHHQFTFRVPPPDPRHH